LKRSGGRIRVRIVTEDSKIRDIILVKEIHQALRTRERYLLRRTESEVSDTTTMMVEIEMKSPKVLRRATYHKTIYSD